MEIQIYLGSKKSSESWKFIKNIRLSNSGKNQINLISADVWKKYYYRLLVEDRKEFLDKDEWLLKKSKGNNIKIDNNTVKLAIMRMKKGRAAGPGDIPIKLIKSGSQKLLEMITILLNPLKPELNPICYLLALLGAHHFLHVSRIRVKSLTLR